MTHQTPSIAAPRAETEGVNLRNRCAIISQVSVAAKPHRVKRGSCDRTNEATARAYDQQTLRRKKQRPHRVACRGGC